MSRLCYLTLFKTKNRNIFYHIHIPKSQVNLIEFSTFKFTRATFLFVMMLIQLGKHLV